MKKRAEWLTFGVFVVTVVVVMYLLVRRGLHGRSEGLAIALLVILLLRVGMFVWNLKRQRKFIERR